MNNEIMGLFSQPEPQQQTVNDKPLRCVVCENDRFFERSAQLNTAVAEFFDLAWANRSATCFVCSECSYVHWFLFD